MNMNKKNSEVSRSKEILSDQYPAEVPSNKRSSLRLSKEHTGSRRETKVETHDKQISSPSKSSEGKTQSSDYYVNATKLFLNKDFSTPYALNKEIAELKRGYQKALADLG